MNVRSYAMATAEEALHQPTASSVAESELSGLFPALQRLDRLLEHAVIAATAAYGAEAAADRFRGLHISTDEVERLLARSPGAPVLWAEHDSQDLRQSKRVEIPGSPGSRGSLACPHLM
jgi:hypothetical protein